MICSYKKNLYVILYVNISKVFMIYATHILH